MITMDQLILYLFLESFIKGSISFNCFETYFLEYYNLKSEHDSISKEEYIIYQDFNTILSRVGIDDDIKQNEGIYFPLDYVIFETEVVYKKIGKILREKSLIDIGTTE